MIICDNEKITPDGCHGAPDFIIEINSPSTHGNDKAPKLYKYLFNGVREYWIVNPYEEQKISVCTMNKENNRIEIDMFNFDDKVKSKIFEGLEIDFAEFSSKWF